jgi:Domain of unknown function (DUF397)
VDLSHIQWRKASYSANGGGDCVEAGAVGRVLVVRDSKDPGGPVLAVAPQAWRVFVQRVKAGASGPA